MRKTMIVIASLLLVMLAANAAKKTAVAHWPSGAVMDEWFRDTLMVDAGTLGKQYVITDYGVKEESSKVQTRQIQSVIDRCRDEGGGVVVIPRGTFVSGALFFHQGTHLYMEKGAYLKGIDDIRHYPLINMHMEGKIMKYFAALINVVDVDGFTLSGSGTIDGNGQRFWDEFWIRRQWNPLCTNLEALRFQLVYVANSSNVTVQGVRLINSPYWTTHFYKCKRTRIVGCSIEAPVGSKTKAPSSDAIDLDGCEDVVIRGCYMNVCDDAVCLKGGKGTWVDRDSTAGPVYNVLVEKCRFSGKRCNGGITFGSEAWDCRDVIMRDCHFDGVAHVVLFKMRTDTPQMYRDVLVENCSGYVSRAVEISPWRQFHDLKAREDMPLSVVDNVVLRDWKIKAERFFLVSRDKNHKYLIKNFTLKDIEANDSHNCMNIGHIDGVSLNNVILNGSKVMLD